MPDVCRPTQACQQTISRSQAMTLLRLPIRFSGGPGTIREIISQAIARSFEFTLHARPPHCLTLEICMGASLWRHSELNLAFERLWKPHNCLPASQYSVKNALVRNSMRALCIAPGLIQLQVGLSRASRVISLGEASKTWDY